MDILKPQPIINGYTSAISQVISFLEYARACTITAVQNCTPAQLDFLLDEKSNSTGTLLRHIAALEFQFRILTFYNRTLDNKELITWYGGYASELSLNYIKNKPISYYTLLLQEQRKITLDCFKMKTDDWLFADNLLHPKASNLFFWYHLAEDELCHVGQIKLIQKRVPDNL
jgi:hypothetical protein